MSDAPEILTAPVETPLMKQYNSIKAKYPDALLLFRVGDFYETFGEDAIKASSILGIVLTKRKNGSAAFVELAGFPHHSLETYLPRLVRAGNRVAICDQLEDPKFAKKIVKRGITELVTPGVSYHEKTIEPVSNQFLAAVIEHSGRWGAAFMDISTGEFFTTEGSRDYLDKLLQGLRPSEVLYSRQQEKAVKEYLRDRVFTFRLDDWVFNLDFATEIITRQFSTRSLKGFGIEHLPCGIMACGAILHYLSETQHDRLGHVRSISRLDENEYVWLDPFTIRNLELVNSPHDSATTLLQIIDRTQTPMGTRKLRRWLLMPLRDISRIEKRNLSVAHLVKHPEELEGIIRDLKPIGDLERLISRVSLGRVNPRELWQLHRALESIAKLKLSLECSPSGELQILGQQIQSIQQVVTLILERMHPDAPATAAKGSVIANGVNQELDELRALAYDGKAYLSRLESQEIERTGISSLKVGYNNVFGYYLEVRNTHKDKVPSDWIRKQTLTQAERYITEELKIYEQKILGAEEKLQSLEQQLYLNLVNEIAAFTPLIQLNAALIARLDCLSSLARVAIDHHYVRPTLNDSHALRIVQGRHPVIERQLPAGETYVSNDIFLDNSGQQIMMITGPNMSGKSAVLRQTALIVIMAQMGAFVPASAADIGIIDKIFTRVGASDNMSSGESTFMVEMNETASILNNLSDRSLVLLDEIGRGTSTYDGVSIAWAIAEYIHDHAKFRAKTLFATHYHELNEMSASFPRIHNFNVSVQETAQKVLFLRKLQPGGSNHSFGIHVAKMAGMPQRVVERSKEILEQLEKSHGEGVSNAERGRMAMQKSEQLSFFQLDDPVLVQVKEQIMNLDLNTITPIEAMMKLNEIRKIIKGKL
jgi:DNA mismatch repair protein MutS